MYEANYNLEEFFCFLVNSIQLYWSSSVLADFAEFFSKQSLTGVSSSTLCPFSFSVALNLHNIVNISFNQKSLQIWVPGGKMWNHAQWTGKALSLPKLMSQKITWTNSLMKCFATSLGEQLVRSQFIVYYYIVFYFFPRSYLHWCLCHIVFRKRRCTMSELVDKNWIKRGEKSFFSPRIHLDTLKINLCECCEW